MSADTASKVELAFRYLRVKYRALWPRRIATAELYEAECSRWARVLEGYSVAQILDAVFVMRRDYRFAPPTAEQFARLMDRQAGRPMDIVTGRRFDRPVSSAESKRFFSEIKTLLGE